MGASWWVTETLSAGPIFFGSWVFWGLVAVVLHELAHGRAAISRGDMTPEWAGHMTWNPLVHVDTWGWIAFALIGIPWGRMPIDPSRIRGRYGLSFVAAAGPATNLLLSVLCIVGMVLWMKFAGGVKDPVQGNVRIFFSTGAWLNMVLMVFNLIPVPPLDGWRIGCNVSRWFESVWEGERGALIGLIAFMVVFWFAAGPVVMIAQRLISLIARALI